jgi:hypothetical protein
VTELEAIELAKKALKRRGTPVRNEPFRASRLEGRRPGWLIVVPLDVPVGFEPNKLFVEVFESDGTISIPPLL